MNALGTAVYPGTFDPVTNGHVDIISRAAKVVGSLIVGVAVTVEKTPMFTSDERVAMLENEISALDGGLAERVSVKPFENLLVDFVEREGASVIIRGLRAVSDFEYEFQLANMNRQLAPELETVFLTPAEHLSFISSSLIREIALLDGDVSNFVPPLVAKALEQKRQERKKR